MTEAAEALEQEWLAVTAKLKSYLEHPEQHTAIVFLLGDMSNATAQRLAHEKGLVVGEPFGGTRMIKRAPGNTADELAMAPK